MISFTQQLEEMVGTEQLTIEQAQAMKREVRAQKDTTTKDLGALMEQQLADEKNKYFADLKGIDLLVAKVKELVGRGQEYEYKQFLKNMQYLSAQLTTMADNTMKLTSEYREKMLEKRGEITEERKLYELNAVLFTGKTKVYNQTKEQLQAIEKQSVLGATCTAEAMRLQKDLLEAENDIISLNHENDEIASRILVNRSVLDTYHKTHAALLEMQSQVQRQKVVYQTHLELALANEKIMSGVQGLKSAKEAYMKAGVFVQDLKKAQDRLHRNPLSAMPAQFDLATPRIESSRDPYQPQWLTVAEQIRKPLYEM